LEKRSRDFDTLEPVTPSLRLLHGAVPIIVLREERGIV
jgi:hypothetical protein